ncbi:efflux RND transporter periplasmic adaptor subunit [Mesorhizobium sp. M2E.F.Ca.ET.219.01.1.1]|uniref:efflux RND transporter periplasmic adaptor subunit n=1 Tax=Mesorhizobium sp. M2E.F.Ca.ET.219.01.1.1 TaxID=2500530 RepID=UPI00187D3379|nr:efflux RND transporter periplasmic adaptor subunit [Mesorhizobium sp. M2E.F.Ca.ET.219.01.1.1]
MTLPISAYSASCQRQEGQVLRFMKVGQRISLVLVLAASGLPGRGLAADGQAPRVTVVAASEKVLEQTVSAVGTVVPRETTLVNADLEGSKINSIRAEEGDLVAQGQVLATLDASKLDIELLQNDAQRSSMPAQLGQAFSALESAMISRDEAEADLRRAEKLVPKGVLSQEALEQRQKALARAEVTVDSSRQAVKVAQAAVETAAAARKDIELRLSYTKIIAPVAGRIVKRSAKVGGVTSSSSEQLFVIANNDEFELEAEIPQAQFNSISVGASTTISLDDGASTLKSAVRFIAPALADGTRLGRARIPLPHGGAAAPVGAFASAQIDVGSRAGIFLPSSAITNTGETPSITILKDNRIERKAVSLGVRRGGLVQVRTGVDEGDLVVLKSGGFMDVGDEAIPVMEQADASANINQN